MMKITDKVYTIDELKAIVKPILEKYPKVKALYVYREYAHGTANPNSLIFFRIVGDKLTLADTIGSEMREELDTKLQKEIVIYHDFELIPHRVEAIKREEVMVYERT